MTRADAEGAARRFLLGLIWTTAAATVTGVLAFCYPDGLGVLRAPVVAAHELAGDLMLASGLAYLWVHLARVWRFAARLTARRSGYLAVLAFALAGATGLWGQVRSLPAGSAVREAHLASSVGLIMLAAAHGAWGLRPKS